MGLYAGEILGLTLPRTDKRLFVFVEMDGCLTDGIAVATGCGFGHRTMRLFDYGKAAATFVDTETGRAVRIWPNPLARERALTYATDAPDRWHAQLQAYQTMPATDLLLARPAQLHVSLAEIISRHGERVVCESCGEDIINEREVHQAGKIVCSACASGAYYTLSSDGRSDQVARELPHPAR